jgi:hypothetical protein
LAIYTKKNVSAVLKPNKCFGGDKEGNLRELQQETEWVRKVGVRGKKTKEQLFESKH